MAIYNKRVDFSKEKLIDQYLKRDSLADFIYGIVRFFGIIVQNIYCVSSYLVLSWIILFPISWIRSDLYSRAENYLYNSLLFIVSSWSMAAGAIIVEAGEEYKHLIDEPEKYPADCEPVVSKRTANGHHKAEKNFQKDSNNHIRKTGSNLELKLAPGETKKSSDTSCNKISRAGDELISLDESENDLNQSNDKLADSSCPKVTTVNNNNDSFGRKLKNSKIDDSNVATKPVTNRATKNSLSRELSLNSDCHKKPRILLLCNHISTADVPLIMQSFSTLTNQSLLWVLDAQFKPTNFGLVCSSHGDFFVAKDSFVDGSLRDQVLKHPDRNLLVLFPEGGFWRKRLDGSNRYALKNSLPMTRYVTHPRFGAFKDLIDPSVDVTHIVDATLLYDDIKNPLSILDIALGNRKEPAILHYKVYKRSEINPTEEWLRNIWLAKDKLLQQYYEDRGSFYKRLEGTMRTARLDWFKVISVHLFYLLVCYLTIYRLFSATSVTMLKARDLYYSNI